jgi:type VI secretion system protein ImpE
MPANPLELYYAGRLQDALAAVTDQVKQKPTDVSARGFLVELLCFQGELERADKQLETIAHQDPSLALGVALARQLIRAEQARQEFFSDGRLPDFLDAPTPRMRLLIEASISLRENKSDEAARLLGDAEAQRPHLAGICDGQPFADLRDIDDLTAGVLEMLTNNGKYYWVPLERVERVEFKKPERARDLLWRKARVVVRDGPDGDVHLPALYPGSARAEDERLRLGQMTDWRGGQGAPVRGVGQRMLLVGDEDRPFVEITELKFEGPKG